MPETNTYKGSLGDPFKTYVKVDPKGIKQKVYSRVLGIEYYEPTIMVRGQKYTDNHMTVYDTVLPLHKRNYFPTVPKYLHYDILTKQMLDYKKDIFTNRYFYFKKFEIEILQTMHGEYYPNFKTSNFNERRIF